MYYLYLLVVVTRIRIPYNCVELILGMVHPSTFERLKTQLVFSILGQTFRPWGSSSVTDGWVEELPLFIEDFSHHFHFLSCDPQQNEKNRKYEY